MKINKNEAVKFTVIIPTRERCGVLRSSLQTCIAQEYDNLEIIVSDNFSGDKTKEIVESFKDKRIRYINTGKRVSMTDNWEFALSCVQEGYVTYLGDDDGLLPGALTELNKIICQTGCEAVSCKAAVYFWPNYINETKRNTLVISLKTSLKKRDSKKILIDVINFRRSYDELPLLYRGFVSYSAIKKVKQESGRFFHSMVPDIYSGIVLACVIESYYYSFKPYAISGASRHSIGGGMDSSFNTDHQASKIYFSEDNVPFHRKLAFAPSTPIIVAESFLQAQDHISYANHFKIDIRKCIKAAIKQANNFSGKQYEIIADAVNKTARLNQITHYEFKVIKARREMPARPIIPVFGLNIIRGHLVIDCVKFEARDVYKAALLCGHILALKKLNFFSLMGVIKTTFSYIKRIIKC